MRQQILPFYLVCDESYSMEGDGIDAINTALPDLHLELSTIPAVCDKTRFCMIGFAGTAEVLLELCDLSDVDAMPAVKARDSTAFGAAFRLLLHQISTDVAMLKRDGNKVYRPVVFFMTDGNPTDSGWEQDFKALTSSALSPKIVAFGVGNGIDRSVIQEVGTFRAFITDGTMSPAAALKEFATALTKSIIASGTTSDENGDIVLQVPRAVPGFIALEVDEV